MVEITVYFDEDDRFEGKPLPDYLLRYLLHHNIRGASVFSAIMGYGHKHHVHHPAQIGGVDERPVMLMFIDEESQVEKVLPHIKEVVKEGLIVRKRAEPA